MQIRMGVLEKLAVFYKDFLLYAEDINFVVS